MSTSASPPKTRVFISFDYDYDNNLRVLLRGQAKNKDTPFALEDWSIKVESAEWREEARRRIRRSAVVTVICGQHTRSAAGVAQEIKIAREEGVPFWLLKGYKDRRCEFPRGSSWFWDTMHEWKWATIEEMCLRKTTPWWKRIW